MPHDTTATPATTGTPTATFFAVPRQESGITLGTTQIVRAARVTRGKHLTLLACLGAGDALRLAGQRIHECAFARATACTLLLSHAPL